MNKHIIRLLLIIALQAGQVLAVTELTSDNAAALLGEAKKPVILDFYTTWCQPCKMMAPLFEQFEQEMGNEYACYRVDAERVPELAEAFEVNSFPTFVIVKNGELIGKFSGASKDYEAFKKKIQETRNFDITKLTHEELNEKLFESIQMGSVADVMTYIEAGADVNTVKENGFMPMTPLIMAFVAARNLQVSTAIITALLDNGADINVTVTIQGATLNILQFAEQSINNGGAVRGLQEAFIACIQSHSGTVNTIAFDTTQPLTQEQLNDALFAAIEKNSLADVATCIASGAQVNAVKQVNEYLSITPLCAVLFYVREIHTLRGVTTALLDAGANPNTAIAALGMTPVQFAQQNCAVVAFMTDLNTKLIAHVQAYQAKKA